MGISCNKAAESGKKEEQSGGGYGCGTNASSPSQYGGYQYSRKASLASRKRLQNRLSTKTRRKKHKHKRKYKGKKNTGRRRHRRRRGGTRKRGRSRY